MKKTNKTFKRFAAITSASLLAACAMAPVAFNAFATVTETEVTAGKITIENTIKGHEYQAYQIFKGKLTKTVDDKNTVETTDDLITETFSDIEWGDNVTVSDALYTELAKIKDGETAIFTQVVDGEAKPLDTAAKVAEALSGKSADVVKAFSAKIMPYLTKGSPSTLSEVKDATDETKITGYELTSATPGYYLIKDADESLTDKHDAYTSYIVKVLGDVSIEPKSEFPTVDKLVWDDDATNADGVWGETADWDINDNQGGKTQFKLIGTIEANNNLVDYETYKVIFNDEMSAGVTFDGIKSVYVGQTEVKAYDATSNPDGYKLTGISQGEAGGSFALEITDLLKHDSNLTDADTVITVIYDAHLNPDAVVSNTGTNSIENKNKVNLQYSNNPNWVAGGSAEEELGKTPDDNVWVATYQILNYKHDDGNESTPLPGVKFQLQDKDGNEIKLACGTDGVYYPWSATDKVEDAATDLISGTNGKFDIKGLDAGTYKLVETQPLPGYNTCNPIEIKIGATHQEAGDGLSASVTMAEDNTGLNNKIENKKGSVLPGTGGIGTTIFYLGGGAMAAIGGIYLISKRRMKKSEE